MQRRALLTGATAIAATFVASRGDVRARPAAVLPEDETYMKLAIEEAAKAAFPFGAVIVKNGEAIARGHNRTGADRDPTAHGEMVAIRSCLATLGPEALKGATVYTTGEPCCMCMGAMVWCEIGRVVYAASLDQLSAVVDQIMLTSEDVASKAAFAPVDIAGNVLSAEAMALFKRD